jgi:hypothetical protein
MIHEYLLIVNADRATTWKGEVGGIAKERDAPKPYQPSHRAHGLSLPSSASTYLATVATDAKEVGAASMCKTRRCRGFGEAMMIADVKKKKNAWRTCASQT